MQNRADLISNFIGEEFRPALSGEARENVEPATGRPLGRVALSGPPDIELAYDVAASARAAWGSTSVEERSAALHAWADALGKQLEDIAYADAIDNGTPVANVRGSVQKGINFVRYYAGLGLELTGKTFPITNHGLHYTTREPYGVVGMITPFNGPAYFAISRMAPAIMAGNAVILKPAEQTPLSTKLIAETTLGILPSGVFNIVHGDAVAGDALVRHPGIPRIHFTGGIPTGLAVQRSAAESMHIKHVSLELGGKNPLIAYPDADPDVVAKAAVQGMNFRRQGQSCGSTSRLFVHESMAPHVTESICAAAQQYTLGLPTDDNAKMGCLVSTKHQQGVLAMIAQAVDEGARLRVGGSAGAGELAQGAFVEPTVFDQVQPWMELARKEVFGPVLAVIPWQDEDDMLAAVNGTEYGLTAAIYTRDIDRAMRTVGKVQSGYVWVNGVENRWLGLPYGGYNDSGIGFEHSLETMKSYTRMKTVSIMFGTE